MKRYSGLLERIQDCLNGGAEDAHTLLRETADILLAQNSAHSYTCQECGKKSWYVSQHHCPAAFQPLYCSENCRKAHRQRQQPGYNLNRRRQRLEKHVGQRTEKNI